jgi:lysozyme
MKTSDNGLNLIEQNEGLVLHVYDDNGKRAVGYGHDLLPSEHFPNGITTLQAQLLLAEDVEKWENAINSFHLTLTQNQFDALVDFTHNLGIGKLAKLLSHGLQEVPNQLPRWKYKEVKGQMVEDAGLLARREKEVALWLASAAR